MVTYKSVKTASGYASVPTTFKLEQAPKQTLWDRIRGFFEPVTTFLTGLEPRERPQRVKIPGTKEVVRIPSIVPTEKIRLPFAKEPIELAKGKLGISKIFPIAANTILETIPKATLLMIQNYRASKAVVAGEKVEPLKLPFDARRLGFDTPEIEDTGTRLIRKFEELNKTNPPQNDLDVWKNAGLSSLMVAVPDSFDAFIAGNVAELGAKTVLKITKYDPMLERSISELGLYPNQRFTGKEFTSRVKESLIESKTITDYSNTLKSARYILEKGTTEKIPIIPRFIKKIQDAAKNLILPLEQYGKGFQVSPIAERMGLPGYMQPRGGLAITPRVGGEGEMAKRVGELTKQGLTPAKIAKQLNITEPAVKSFLGIVRAIPTELQPPIPSTPVPQEVLEISGKPIKDPIIKLNELLKQAKPARKGLEKAYTEERAKRIAQVESFIDKNIDQIGGEEGYRNILAKLKGELVAPEAKIKFEPIKDKLTKEQLKSLYIRTWKHPYLDSWEKISAADGFSRLLTGEIPRPKQLVLLEEIYGTELIKNILSKRAIWGKTGELFLELANLPRALLATADMSGFLRQGIIPVVGHPIISAKAIGKTFQFAFSPKAFAQYFKDLEKDPLYSLMRKSKLSITDPSKLSGGMAAREEPFMSRLLQNVPIGGEIIKFAERSYVGFLDKVRVDVFKTWADELLSKGISPVKDIEIFKSVANVVNTFTGRGSMGALNKITPHLNTIFFSPRLISARFNALNPVWYAKMPPEIRKKAISDFAKFVAAGLTTLAIVKASGLAEVEVDPRSSDFGKIKVGNTRYDIWAGFQQWARVFAQVITGERKNTSTGEIVSLNKDEYPFTTRKETLLRFIEGKLAPVPALINELMSGAKTFTGEDMTLKTISREKLIPMYIQDIADAYADGSLGRAIGAGTAAFFGIGVQTWEERKRVLPPSGIKLPMFPGLEGTKLPAMPGIEY